MNDYLNGTLFPHLRLLILQLLAQQPGEEANDTLIVAGVQATRQIPASADQVRTALGWLVEQGLLTAEDMGRFRLYALTERAGEHLARRVRVDGVAKSER